jgi:23S rRNA (cytosine1962-C5)-methyltransferase
VTSGLRGYKDVNLQALRRLAPGGWLITCSCSQHVDRAAFRDVVAAAARMPGGRVTGRRRPDIRWTIRRRSPHPEGEY